MNLGSIIAVIIIILLILVIISLVTSKSDVNDATTETVYAWSDINTSGDYTNNYTYYIWINVQDWNYEYGKEKIVFTQGGAADGSSPNFRMSLGSTNNNVNFKVYTSAGLDSACEIVNFPLQKWTFFLMSVYGKYMDVYVDGKLVKTCILNNVAQPQLEIDDSVYLTPGGGFDGYTASLNYIGNATNPQQAYNLYSKGYSGNILANLFNKFRIRFTFLIDNEDKGSFEI